MQKFRFLAPLLFFPGTLQIYKEILKKNRKDHQKEKKYINVFKSAI